MLKTQVNWAILGTSYISEVMAQAIQESNSGELVAVGSRSMLTADKFSKKFLIPNVYDDYAKLLNDNHVDVVYIGLPNHVHKDWIIRCAQAGKHILCEKPLVVSIEEAREVISAIDKYKVFCMEALMYRCHPLTSKLREIIQSRTIGQVKLYNATYTAHISDVANPVAGGSIRNLGCYPISLVRMLAGSEPIEICGTGRLCITSGNDNQASVMLKFADDSIAVISTADDIKMRWQFDVYGTGGHLRMVTNPWLPGKDNKIQLILNNNDEAFEINLSADKSLYTYQIDYMNTRIINKDMLDYDGVSLVDSLGNTVVLETWLQQVKSLLKPKAMHS